MDRVTIKDIYPDAKPVLSYHSCLVCARCGTHLCADGGVNPIEREFHLEGKCNG